MLKLFLACSVASLCALYPGRASAGDADTHPCKADIEKLCKGEKGHEGLHRCLHEHESELSDACKAHVAEMKEKMKEKKEEVMAACKGDVDKLCPGVQPGGGAIRKCLHEHKDQVSDSCKATMRPGHGADKMK